MKYRPRQEEVLAKRWDGANANELIKWSKEVEASPRTIMGHTVASGTEFLYICTDSGVIPVSTGDYVVLRGDKTLTAMKPHEFFARFEECGNVSG